jgi:plasmid replication initiation protein
MKTKTPKKNSLQNTSHKSHTIIKSRDLNEAHFPNFSLNEYRLFSLILSKAIRVDKSNTKEFIKAFCETHIVTPHEFSEIFEVPINHCYGILKDSVDTLTNKKIIVKSSIGNIHIPICSMAVYNETEHHLEIRLSHEIIPYIDVSVKFVKTKLYQIAKFKSLYSIRLYELVVSFRSLGKFSISVERLRFLLGVSEDKLKAYKDFKQRALIHAINEVNKICNFDIKNTEKKESKKVAIINFTCKKPKSKELDDDSVDTNKTLSITHQEDVRIRLVKLCVDKKIVNKYKNCSDAKLEKAYKATKKVVEARRLRTTATAYFRYLMEN